jgi:transcriptional regulator with GAF, ATPase, and Fis domain
MALFIILDGPDAGRESHVRPGQALVFGRGEDADVQVIDRNASRHHAHLTWCEGLPTLVDLGSANGTLVNGLPINQIALLDGDEVRLGETRLLYQESPRAARKKTTGGLKVGNPSGSFRAITPADVTTQAFQLPPASRQMDALYDTYNKLKSLYRALQSFTAAKSSDELIRIAADTVLLAVPCERVAVFLVGEGGRLVPNTQSWRDDVPEEAHRDHDAVPADLLDEMQRARAPLFFYDTSGTGDGEDDPILSADPRERASTVIAAPILEGRTLRGMIVADTPVGGVLLKKNDLDLVGTLAHQMGEPLGRLEQIERLESSHASAQEQQARSGIAIVTRSPVMQPILQMVRQVAPTEAPVLVRGESGTGKELMARAIHNLSMRRDRALVCVNCAALPESLIESELFGHEKGAFTGAFTRRPGKFESADGGTIFLDEIGDLPMSAQSKLLRVLQEGEIQRIGSTSPIMVNCRLIAATNVPLEEAVKKNTFREDLYYRIKVVEIHVPPLRERFQDIAILADFYLDQFKKKIPTAVKSIGPEAIQAMAAYRWPGNVRELRNVIERAIVLATGSTLTLDDLPPEIADAFLEGADIGGGGEDGGGARGGEGSAAGGKPGGSSGLRGRGTAPGTVRLGLGGGLDEVPSLADVEKRHIRTVLDVVKGNKVKAAKILGISRTTLYEKIKAYSLEG